MRTTPQDRVAEGRMIQAVIDRAPGGWQAFFKKHERLILACLRRVYARYSVPLSRDELEDLVSQVCLDLLRADFRKLKLFDPDRGYRLSSWVGLIATNIAHDALRRRAPPSTSTDDEDSPLSELQSSLPDPLEQVTQKEQMELLARAVALLTPTDQEFIRLYYLEQLTPDEIGVKTGVSVNTVYSRKNKVRAKLVKIMKSFV